MSANNCAEYQDVGKTAQISEDPTLAPESMLLEVLHAADKIDAGHWRMRCPAHQGAASSTLEVSLEAGRFRLHCDCGCTTDEILHAAIAASAQRLKEASREAAIWRPKIPPRQRFATRLQQKDPMGCTRNQP